MAKKTALADLYVGAYKVHDKGQEIDVSPEDVEKYGWADFLAGSSTKAAETAKEEAITNPGDPGVGASSGDPNTGKTPVAKK